MERFTGIVKRSIRFPQYIDISKGKAVYENGCLVIYIPKAKNQFIIDAICKISIF
jgi:HSP20 family protein